MSEPVRVLVLEDDEGMRDMIATVLEGEGYEVRAVERGVEAVQLASQEAFDLVIADIRMEGMDGLEALQRVREHQPQVRSLVVTGYSTEDDSIRAIRLGVGDYLKKPFDFKEFLGSVRRLVSSRRQEAARRAMEDRLRAGWLRSTEALARMLDSLQHPGRPEKGLMGAADLATRLADSLGLGRQSRETTRLATLIAGLGALEGVPFDPTADELPAGLALVLRHLEERWDGTGGPDGLAGEQIPIETRVVMVAVNEDRSPGRCDPRVLSALEQTPRAPGQDPSGHLRGLLSLGRALEEKGDRDGARQAYGEIALVAHVGAETIEAHLGLARLSADPGEEARKAAALASQVGPAAAAQAYLRAGQLLRDATLLSQAAHLAHELREPRDEALARLSARVLAQAELDEIQPLQTLLAPENAWELARAAPWLLKFLLEHPGHATVDRALTQLARDVPRELESRLDGLSARARRAAARAAAQAGASRILARLATDPDTEVRALAAQASPDEQRLPPVLRIFTLGPMEVFRGEDRVTDKGWRSQKGRQLFAFLAAQKGAPVAEDVLIDAFWPEDADKGRRNLYWYCSTLRAGLRPEGFEEIDYIQRASGCLQLNPQLPRWHDLEEFELAGEQGLRSGNADLLRRAVTLHRGPFLEACYMDWTNPIRDRALALLGDCLGELLRRAAGPQESLEHAQRLLGLDPCSQEAYEAALEAQLALGRPQAAVRLYERCQKVLAEELGMEPSIRLVELYQRARISL